MRQLSSDECDRLESEHGILLPSLYRNLLLDTGYGPIGQSSQIYHPSEIRDLYEPFFDDPSALFNLYFPFGCNNVEQTLWVIDTDRELAATIHHETVPDDWLDEEWLEYRDWCESHLPNV